MNVLLISYYFEPFPGVGAKRLTYWANAFWKDANLNGSCTVVTATPQKQQRRDVYFVEDRKGSLLEKLFQGYSWMRPLKAFFNSADIKVDVAIISGGPFGHFPIQSFLRRRFGCKVILDLRDPMAGNPRFGTFYLKDQLKRVFERVMLHSADRILTVNPCCVDLMPSSVSRNKISIVENGYDETIVDAIPAEKFNDGNFHIIHAGKFYEDPTPFVREMASFNSQSKDRKYIFHHVGELDPRLIQFGMQYIVQHGEIPYVEVVRLMKRCTLGFLITRTHLLEFNTKVFDYVGCDLDMFLITDGRPEDVCLYRLTSRLDKKTYWIHSDPNAIGSALRSYKANSSTFQNKEDFTRRHGYRKLKSIVDEELTNQSGLHH